MLNPLSMVKISKVYLFWDKIHVDAEVILPEKNTQIILEMPHSYLWFPICVNMDLVFAPIF